MVIRLEYIVKVGTKYQLNDESINEYIMMNIFLVFRSLSSNTAGVLNETWAAYDYLGAPPVCDSVCVALLFVLCGVPFCFVCIVSYAANVAGVSGLSSVDCPFGFLYHNIFM